MQIVLVNYQSIMIPLLNCKYNNKILKNNINTVIFFSDFNFNFELNVFSFR